MRRVILAITSTVVGLVLLLSFKTHQPALALATPAKSSTAASATGTEPTGTTTTPTPASSSTPSATPSASAGGTKTYTGEAADTRYGPVQVQVTVTDGKVTAATSTEYPENDPRDYQINSYAIPQLNAETVSSGSANIDMVSGATYTSEGYLSSLQSALDKAGLS